MLVWDHIITFSDEVLSPGVFHVPFVTSITYRLNSYGCVLAKGLVSFCLL